MTAISPSRTPTTRCPLRCKAGDKLWVRGGTQTVNISTPDHQWAATHDRAEHPGERLTHPAHLPPEKMAGLMVSREGCQATAADIGPATSQVVAALLADPVVDRLQTTKRLLGLRERYGDAHLEAACAKALQFDEPAYVTIKRILLNGLEGAPDDNRDGGGDPGAHLRPQCRRFARPSVWRCGTPHGSPSCADGRRCVELRHQLTPHLTKLRLSGILQTLEARDRQAVDGHWSYIEFLARLLEDEVERRAQKQLALRLRRATVNSTKTLEMFDFASTRPSIASRCCNWAAATSCARSAMC